MTRRLTTWNVCGLNNLSKQTYFKNHVLNSWFSDFVVLTETKLNNINCTSFLNTLTCNWSCLNSSHPDDTKGGVIILIKKSVQVDLTSVQTDAQGHWVAFKITSNTIPWWLVGLYLPADPRGKDITLNNLNLDFIPINENVVFAGDINLLQSPSTQSLSSKDNTSYP